MKKIKFIATLTIAFLFCCSIVFAQINVEFTKSNFKNRKTGFKEAMKNLKEGDGYYQVGGGAYRGALDYYLKANRFNPDNAMLNYKIGVCYLFSVQKVKSIEFFKKAFKLNKFVAADINYMLAQGYHLNLEFDKAIEEYNNFKRTLSPRELQEWINIVKKKIQECNNGKELVKNEVRVFIDNVGSAINSSYPDYSPIISADESMMIFTSRRENTTGGGRDPGDLKYFEDVYVSYNINGKWQRAENIGKPINTNNNDATVGLSPDGQELFIFNGRKMGGDIFVCELKGDKWTSPDDKTLQKYINTEFHESSASFSYNGKTMYFVSDKEIDNYGKHDIYISYLDDKGKWGRSENIGNVINTEYDDEGVFMHPDGRSIYFSSKGHNTMGGYDIFSSTLQDDGTWTKPKNIGYPINTPDDDVFFVISASGLHGYYSSPKEGGFGDHDIYMITFMGPEKPLVQSNEDNLIASIANPVSETIIEKTVDIKTIRLTILKGIITDELTKNPLDASIELVDNEKNEVINTIYSNSKTGKYLISLPSGKNYGIAVKKENYLFHSENFDIPKATAYQEIVKDIELKSIAVGSKIILKNIFFDYARATLRPASYAELGRLSMLLSDIPSLKIEISGHTDNQGSLKTNTRLSDARAKAVVDYLINQGIKAERLTFKGYAYFQPIATNDTDEGRQLNRRVEFKVLSK